MLKIGRKSNVLTFIRCHVLNHHMWQLCGCKMWLMCIWCLKKQEAVEHDVVCRMLAPKPNVDNPRD